MKEDLDLKKRIGKERIKVRIEDSLNEIVEDNEYDLSQNYDIDRQIQLDQFEKEYQSNLEILLQDTTSLHKSPNDKEIYRKALQHRYQIKHKNLIKERRRDLISDFENNKFKIRDEFSWKLQDLELEQQEI